MPKNGFVMRFFGCAQLPVGVVGVQRSIQLSYDRTFSLIRSDGRGYQSKIHNRDTYYTTEFSG